MPKFVLAYHGSPKLDSKEAGAAHMAEWQNWMQSLGDAVVDPGVPVGPSITILPDGTVKNDGGTNPLVGFTILQADNIEEVIKMTKPCPHITAGGSIEVAPVMDMEM